MRTLLFALIAPCAAVYAQDTSASLSGIVHDPDGAAVADAKVTLTDQANGFLRAARTSKTGFYSFANLTPATFTLEIESPGFKTWRETGITIASEESRSLGQIRLEIGRATESITVSADSAAVELSTGERSGTLSGDQLTAIALRGRDIFDAISLLPGVIDTTDGRDSPSPTSISGIYILGGRNDQKNMTVDGVTNLDTGSNTSVHSMPSMDSVAEVKVLMSAYSAENGRNPSAINVITKGGGKQFHGTASYYFRNEDLNANDFFANEAGRPRARYRYNIGSYTVGGPILLPRLHSLRNKLFFFFSQEFQRQLVTYGVEEKTVPTALERQGNFSQSYTTGGVPGSFHVNDPLANKTQFPGNIIPANRINPIGQAILDMFPLPNFTDPNPANRYQWNYYANFSEPYPRRTETLRFDFSPKETWRLSVSASNNADSQAVPYNVGAAGWVAGSLNFPLSPISFQQPGRLLAVRSTNSLGNTAINEIVLAVSQNTLTYAPLDPSLVDRTKLGVTLAQRNPALNTLNAIPDMSFSGVQNYANPSMSDGVPYFNQNTIYSLTDSLSKIMGMHSLKAGVYFEHTGKIQSASTLTRGNISFNQDGNNALDANEPYGTALLGNYDSYAESTGRPQGKFEYINLEWFAQDTWRVRPNLSLDFGVRLYHDPPQYDARHQIGSFSPAAWDPASAPVLLRPVTVNGVKVAQNPVTLQTYSAGLIGDFAPGIGNPADGILIGGKNGVPDGLFHVAPVGVAPRFGFAWDPFGRGRTAIRGGGGIYLDRIQGNPVMNLLGPPAYFSPSQFYGTFSDIAASAGSGFLSPTSTVYSIAGPGHQQVVYNYNVSVSRQFSRSDIAEVGYTGSLGRHLLWERNINAVPLGATFLNLNPLNRDPTTTSSALPTNFLRPYQGFGDIYLYEFANNSNYNALLASFSHRVARGVSLSASYTWSKALDASDSYSSAVDPFLNPRSRNYGTAGYDRRQVFTTNFSWVLPRPGLATGIRPLGWVTDNWTISGVARFLTGGPTTPSYSLVSGIASPTGSPSDGARPQVINPTAPLPARFGPPPEPANQANVPWAIASNTPQLGNVGRDTFYGPGTNNWDLSAYRQVRMGERVTTQLRLESYNTFNHTQYSSLNTALQFDSTGKMVNAAFDTPNAARPARRVQVAVRITF